VQFFHDSKLLKSYKYELEDLSPGIVRVSYIFTYYTPCLIRNPFTCQRCYQMEYLPKYITFESTKGNWLLLKYN
jgi:hypothetical protein